MVRPRKGLLLVLLAAASCIGCVLCVRLPSEVSETDHQNKLDTSHVHNTTASESTLNNASVPAERQSLEQDTDKSDKDNTLNNNEPLILRRIPTIEDAMFNLPQLMDAMLSSALNSMERASGGLLSDLAGPSIDHALSEDKQKLIVRLRFRKLSEESDDKVRRKLALAVLGKRHLRLKLETETEMGISSTVNVMPLPHRVTQEGVRVYPMEDGTIHIALRILDDEKEGSTSRQSVASIFKPLFESFLRQSDRQAHGDFVENLPTQADLETCRSRFEDDKLARMKCRCDATPSVSHRAICYGDFIAKCVTLARKIKHLGDAATIAKHEAIECADDDNRADCLNQVATRLLTVLSKPDGSKDDDVAMRIRAALESEDNSSPTFHLLLWFLLRKLLLVLSVFFLLFAALIFIAIRCNRHVQIAGVLSEFSSMLFSRSSGLDRSESKRSSSRRGGSKVALGNRKIA